MTRHAERRAGDYAFHANLQRDPSVKRDPFTPQDFMPSRNQAHHEPTREEWLLNMRLMNAAFGGEDLTHNNG